VRFFIKLHLLKCPWPLSRAFTVGVCQRLNFEEWLPKLNNPPPLRFRRLHVERVIELSPKVISEVSDYARVHLSIAGQRARGRISAHFIAGPGSDVSRAETLGSDLHLSYEVWCGNARICARVQNVIEDRHKVNLMPAAD